MAGSIVRSTSLDSRERQSSRQRSTRKKGGIAVAAVGNDPKRVVDSEDGALDFARRCLPPQQEVITDDITRSASRRPE
jgi:cobalamin-dependent methionine synthase I